MIVIGKVISKRSIKVTKSLISNWGIEAGDGIEAGCSIKAGDGIEAGCGIKAGLSITGKWISSRLRIFAGLMIWKKPTVEETQINVEEVKQGEICFGKLNLLKKTKNK